MFRQGQLLLGIVIGGTLAGALLPRHIVAQIHDLPDRSYSASQADAGDGKGRLPDNLSQSDENLQEGQATDGEKGGLSETARKRQIIERALEKASREFGVPLPILQAIALVQSRWDQMIPRGLADTPPAYGVMGLRDDGILGHSLVEAAALLGETKERLKLNPGENIRGAAALLATIAARGGGGCSGCGSDLLSWSQAIAEFSGLRDQSLAESFAFRVLRVVQAGHDENGIMIEAHPELDLSHFSEKAQRANMPRASIRGPRSPVAEISLGSGDYPDAVWCGPEPDSSCPPPLTNYQSGRGGYSINKIILHTTEGTAESALATFLDGTSLTSAHYIVTGDGAVWQVVSDTDTAYHAGNLEYNEEAVGIELEGWADGSPTGDFSWQTSAQFSALQSLMAWLIGRHSITADRQHVIGHNQVPGVTTSGTCPDGGVFAGPSQWGGACNHHDPGAWWNWTALMAELLSPPQYQVLYVTGTCSVNTLADPVGPNMTSVWPGQQFVAYDISTDGQWYLIFVTGREAAQLHITNPGEFHWDGWLPASCADVEPGVQQLQVAGVLPYRLLARDGTSSSSTVLAHTIDGKRHVGTGSIQTGYDGQTWYEYDLAWDTARQTGWSSGAYLSESSTGATPGVVTLAANPVGGSTATLNGSVIPNGLSTTAWFEWGTTSDLGSPNLTPSQPLGSGTDSEALSANLTGLTGNKIYYFRVVAANANGTSKGGILSFQTQPVTAPTVSTNPATSIGVNGATLNGQLNPNGSPSVGWFEYGTTNDPSTFTQTASQPIGSDNLNHQFSWTLSNLNPGTIYYYRAAGSNGGGVTEASNILTFTTSSSTSAVVTTSSPTSVTSSSATLNGSINPAGASGTASFQYTTDPTFTSNTSTCPWYNGYCVNVTANSSTQAFSYTLSSLPTNATYYFRIVFHNSGTNTDIPGGALSFTTLQPVETTLPASSVTSSSATLNGTVNPAGASGTASFRYSYTDPTLTSYSTAGGQNVTANSNTQAFSATVSQLLTNKTYYYQVVFYNSGNSTYQLGNVLSFSTLQSVETTLPASSVTSSSATLNGTINPAGSGGTAYFRYSCTDPTLTSYSQAGGQNVTANSTTQAFSTTVSYPTTNTNCYYQIDFYNAGNSTHQLGSIVSFATVGIAISVSPSSVTLIQGDGSQAVIVNLSRTNYTGSVTLATSTLPSGVTASYTQPGTGNSGSISLLAASNATLVSNQTITITASGSGVSSVDSTFSLTVAGGGPIAGLSPSSLTFSGQLVGTASTSQPVTLSNTGTASLTIASITASGDFSQTNTCGSSVAASSSCTISVTFTPTASGTRTGTLTITDNNKAVAGSIQTASLTGTGTAPVAGVSPGSLTFSGQTVGTTSASQSITITNAGTAALTVTGIVASGDFSQTNNCGSSVASSSSCAINVTFTPTTSGTRTGTLTIADNSNGLAGSIQMVSLSGAGIAPPVSLSSSSLTFPPQIVGTSSSVQTVMLTNTGNAPLTISSISTSGDFSQTNTCGTIVSAGASCAISVTFKPAATGTMTGTLSIYDNAAGSPQTVALSGTGMVFTSGPHPPVLPPRRPSNPVPRQPVRVLPPTPPVTEPIPVPTPVPAISLAPSALTFAAQGVGTRSSAQTVTLVNTGNGTLTLTGIVTSANFGQTNNCGGSVATRGSCTINVTFAPTATGSLAGALTVTDNSNGVAGSQQTVTLSGTGTNSVVH